MNNSWVNVTMNGVRQVCNGNVYCQDCTTPCDQEQKRRKVVQ